MHLKSGVRYILTSGYQDSNLGPLLPKSNALPNWATSRCYFFRIACTNTKRTDIFVYIMGQTMGKIICLIDLKTCQFFSAEVNLLTAGQLGRAELRQQVIFSKQLTCFENLTCCLSSARRDCLAVKTITSAEKNCLVFRSI